MVLTDCAKYQDWQVIAAAFAWRRSGQGGSVVRVANCNEKDTKNYDKKMLEYVDTHMAPLVSRTSSLFAEASNRLLCCLVQSCDVRMLQTTGQVDIASQVTFLSLSHVVVSVGQPSVL